jgi:hypothetical protein
LDAISNISKHTGKATDDTWYLEPPKIAFTAAPTAQEITPCVTEKPQKKERAKAIGNKSRNNFTPDTISFINDRSEHLS